MKNFMIFLGIVLMIAAALFYKQVWALFAGMTPLEAMKQIVTFILHVAVATIAAYTAMKLPEFVRPWLRLRKRQSMIERRMRRAVEPVTKAPRLNSLVMALLKATPSALAGTSPKRRTRLEEEGNEEPRINLDL